MFVPQIIGQADPAHASMIVGFGKSKAADVGCVLMTLTASVNVLTGQQLTPRAVNELARAYGPGKGYDGASIYSTNIAGLLGCKKTPSIDKTRDLRLLKETISFGLTGVSPFGPKHDGGPGLAILRVDYDIANLKTNNHTICCFAAPGVDGADSYEYSPRGGYVCMDPAGSGKIIILDDDLFIQRTIKRKYWIVGVAPIYKRADAPDDG